MAQTQITNGLSFPTELQHLFDRDGVPVAVAVTKATFSIERDRLAPASEQVGILASGEPWGEAGKSSYKYEPECCYYKPGTDVVLVGSAFPPFAAATQVQVAIAVGSLRKRAIVFGDRFWVRTLTGTYLSSPEPFESMPLVYERAFGGWDRSDPDPKRHICNTRNPVGTGFAKTFAPNQERIPLPNIENPDDLITSMDSRPKPMGFGFTSSHWQPRAAMAGTYDSSWTQNRAPLLPEDFDPLFFNGASEGLISDGYLSGNERVELQNCSRQAFVSFALPGLSPPRCRFRIAGQPDQLLTGKLDTVVINTLENIVILTWRCHHSLPRGPEFLLELSVS